MLVRLGARRASEAIRLQKLHTRIRLKIGSSIASVINVIEHILEAKVYMFRLRHNFIAVVIYDILATLLKIIRSTQWKSKCARKFSRAEFPIIYLQNLLGVRNILNEL